MVRMLVRFDDVDMNYSIYPVGQRRREETCHTSPNDPVETREVCTCPERSWFMPCISTITSPARLDAFTATLRATTVSCSPPERKNLWKYRWRLEADHCLRCAAIRWNPAGLNSKQMRPINLQVSVGRLMKTNRQTVKGAIHRVAFAAH